ncbi:MAG: hypothetical protein CMD92_00210 [Gammaproteobacteria bacterium]|nr:hypothetical protein [Gammaproteobacteria bacterium]HBW84343.1 hypothetical protein [Gammaproteobacteria bacterium]|tara:strand:- start:2073 stop:2363 length:291 start_codon:yes stop_codon:yes gene_type:complete
MHEHKVAKEQGVRAENKEALITTLILIVRMGNGQLAFGMKKEPLIALRCSGIGTALSFCSRQEDLTSRPLVGRRGMFACWFDFQDSANFMEQIKWR